MNYNKTHTYFTHLILHSLLMTIFLSCSFGQIKSSNAVFKEAGTKIPKVTQERWVKSKLDSMSLDEKIGQLMMIRAHSNLGIDHIKNVESLIEKYHVGSLCFFQGDPMTQATLTNKYQKLSKIPLLIAMDAEWGLGMRFPETTISYPRQLTLGAITDNREIYNMGKRIAYELKRIGVHLNFAPVADVNNNPLNPVINNRSFGEDRYNVAAKSLEYMRGMQESGVIACAKHFPGHGDTDTDSHLDLPIIKHNRARLDSIELYPFDLLVDRGVKSVMVAHLSVPSLDPRNNMPTTLSAPTIQGVLREEMGFTGLIITDAMEMKGVTKHFSPGQAEAEAIRAGNDILCLPVDVPKAFGYIKKYIEEGKISIEQIDESVTRILNAKFEAGLFARPQIALNQLMEEINDNKGLAIKSQLLEKAITLAKDSDNKIPFQDVSQKRYATLSIGDGKTVFQNRCESYVPSKNLSIPYQSNTSLHSAILNELENFDRVIVSLHKMSKYANRNFGINQMTLDLLEKINEQNEMTLVVFGSPYSLSLLSKYPTILMCYTDDEIMQDRAAQALFGVFDIRGRLPVGSTESLQFGDGVQRAGLKRLGFSFPEEVDMYSDTLDNIDEIVEEMIERRAAPGCQILVARSGRIVYQKAYGQHTYNGGKKVSNTDLYDVASITKVASGTIATMMLDDHGQLDIDGTLTPFHPSIDTSNKRDIVIRDMLAHHAGLVGWIPFYTKTIDLKSKRDKPKPQYYRKNIQDSFSIPVANHIYMRNDYIDTMYHEIIMSDLRNNTNYKYSDLGFYFVKMIIENISGKSLDVFVQDNYYRPLGLFRTGYNPRTFIPLNEIVPTEEDKYFRNQKIQGHVHDMGAAMMGGVSGHAGLFTTSYELGVIFQMLLNGGHYGGKEFVSPEIIKKYTTRYPGSTRRGLGFDMKELDTRRTLNMSELASESTFGHLGFTGTCVFADPENDLIYIMLSNRTYPSMRNNKFGRYNYRPRIQSVVYEALYPLMLVN